MSVTLKKSTILYHLKRSAGDKAGDPKFLGIIIIIPIKVSHHSFVNFFFSVFLSKRKIKR